MGTQEAGQITGTKDKDYNVIWFTEQCLSNVLRLETYVEDAEREGDSELADFFRRAQETSRKGAEQGKATLAKRLSGIGKDAVEARVEDVAATVYTVPTDRPESDGTLEWDATAIVVVEASAAGHRGLGYT